MLKRIAALLFVLAIAGQVYAGVCGCMDANDEATHSCCKRSRSSSGAIKAKDCCAADCSRPQTERPTQDRSNPRPQIKLQAVTPSVQLPAVSVERTSVTPLLTKQRLTDHRLKRPRPPELYLRHHAFLI